MEPKSVMGYVQACASGDLSFFECAPIVEIAIIAGLLIAAVALLVAVRIEFRGDAHPEADATG